MLTQVAVPCRRLRPALSHTLSHKLARGLGHSVSLALSYSVPRMLNAFLSPTMLPSMRLTMAHALTRALTHSLAPTLLHTLSSSPQEKGWCFHCATQQIYCERCHHSQKRLYYAMYYSDYYASYFSDYYSDYFAQLTEMETSIGRHYTEKAASVNKKPHKLVINCRWELLLLGPVVQCRKTSIPYSSFHFDFLISHALSMNGHILYLEV